MEYIVYTDGAANKEKDKIGFSYFIRTKDRFITKKSFSSYGSNIMTAEILGVGMAAECLLKTVELSKEDSVIFLVDSKTAVSYISDRVFGKTLTEEGYEEWISHLSKDEPIPNIGDHVVVPNIGSYDKRARVAVNKVLELNEKTNVVFDKAWAHTNTKTGNALADRLAKYALRMATWR